MSNITVNTDSLYSLIDQKGLKKGFVATQLGLSRQGFLNKATGKNEFTYSEACKLFNILSASEEEQQKIFEKM